MLSQDWHEKIILYFKFLFFHLQFRERGRDTLHADILEKDIYDLIIILHAAIQDHSLAPNWMKDPQPGFEERLSGLIWERGFVVPKILAGG
jgi:hypothetical protein